MPFSASQHSDAKTKLQGFFFYKVLLKEQVVDSDSCEKNEAGGFEAQKKCECRDMSVLSKFIGYF